MPKLMSYQTKLFQGSINAAIQPPDAANTYKAKSHPYTYGIIFHMRNIRLLWVTVFSLLTCVTMLQGQGANSPRRNSDLLLDEARRGCLLEQEILEREISGLRGQLDLIAPPTLDTSWRNIRQGEFETDERFNNRIASARREADRRHSREMHDYNNLREEKLKQIASLEAKRNDVHQYRRQFIANSNKYLFHYSYAITADLPLYNRETKAFFPVNIFHEIDFSHSSTDTLRGRLTSPHMLRARFQFQGNDHLEVARRFKEAVQNREVFIKLTGHPVFIDVESPIVVNPPSTRTVERSTAERVGIGAVMLAIIGVAAALGGDITQIPPSAFDDDMSHKVVHERAVTTPGYLYKFEFIIQEVEILDSEGVPFRNVRLILPTRDDGETTQ